MGLENDGTNYKNLFSKTEEGTAIPDFEEVMQFSHRKKKLSSIPIMTLLVILFSALGYGMYLYLHKPEKTTFSQTETELLKQKPLVWEWKSPTTSLLKTSPNGVINFESPSDFLSPQIISSPGYDSKKTN